MARTPRPAAAPAPRAAGSAGVAERTERATDGGADVAKVYLTSLLATGCAGMSWFTGVQQLQAQEIAEWRRALENALRDTEHAADAQALLAVGTELAQLQLAMTIRHLGSAFARWVESDLQLAERLGTEAAALTQQSLPGSVHAESANGQGRSALKEFGRLQDQWIDLTQQWLDAAGVRPSH